MKSHDHVPRVSYAVLRDASCADVLLARARADGNTNEGNGLQIRWTGVLRAEVHDEDGVLSHIQLRQVHSRQVDEVHAGHTGVTVAVRVPSDARGSDTCSIVGADARSGFD